MTYSNFLSNLNGLRFIAATYTIMFHFWSVPGNSWLNRFYGHGHISVPFFFLLSGFVLAYRYGNYEFKGNRLLYFKKRFIRIAPVYYLAMGLATSLIYLHYLNGKVLTIGEYIYFSYIHLALLQSLIPSEDLMLYWNVHSWSISVEIFLYAISIFLIPILMKLKGKGILLAWTATLIGNSILFWGLDLKTHFAPAYIMTFATGILMANTYINYRPQVAKYGSILFWGSFIGILGLLFSTLDRSFFSAFNPVFHILFSALLLGAAVSSPSTKWLRFSWMIYLGDISYGMYILQAPVKLVTQQAWTKVFRLPEASGHLYNFTLLVMVVIISAVVHSFYDKPLQKKLRNFTQRKVGDE